MAAEPEINTSATDDTALSPLQAYAAAWDVTDRVRRDTLLRIACREDVQISSPRIQGLPRLQSTGISALSDYIDRVFDAAYERPTVPQFREGQLNFGWSLISQDGSKLDEGHDLAKVDSTGRVQSIQIFSGTPPPPQAVDDLLRNLS